MEDDVDSGTDIKHTTLNLPLHSPCIPTDEGEEMAGVRSDSDEDSEAAPPGGATPHSRETVARTAAPVAMDTDDVNLPGLSMANYDWLTELMMKSN